jgi:hypothetical protein
MSMNIVHTFLILMCLSEERMEMKLVCVYRTEKCPCRLSSQTHAVMRHATEQYSHCPWSHYLFFLRVINEAGMIASIDIDYYFFCTTCFNSILKDRRSSVTSTLFLLFG